MASRIVICCLKPALATSTVTERDIYEVFAGFGRIEKVFIFERKALVKAFVQFESEDSALGAVLALNKAPTLLGTVCAFRSKKKRIINRLSLPDKQLVDDLLAS